MAAVTKLEDEKHTNSLNETRCCLTKKELNISGEIQGNKQPKKEYTGRTKLGYNLKQFCIFKNFTSLFWTQEQAQETRAGDLTHEDYQHYQHYQHSQHYDDDELERLDRLESLESLENLSKMPPLVSSVFTTERNSGPFYRKLEDHYQVSDSVLGQGGYGVVVAVVRKSDGCVFACKSISKLRRVVCIKDPMLANTAVPSEVYYLSRLHHESIIELVDFFEDEQHWHAIMELHGETDLFDRVEEKKFSEDEVRYIICQLIDALMYLESQDICHSDIKDENILIDKENRIKLIDFGSAYRIGDDNTKDGFKQKRQLFQGTINYAPPEVVSGNGYYAIPSEVWKLGCLMYILCFRQMPFTSPKSIMFDDLRMPDFPLVSKDARILILKMLDKRPMYRPSFSQIKSDKWFKNSRV